MDRIYLDSNIFRYLKINENNNTSSLFKNLIQSKQDLIFYYSYAHLSDFSRDKTDKKFEDLLFMEQLVDSNFLNLRSDEEFVNVQIAFPSDAYNIMSFVPMNELLNFHELMEELEILEDDSAEIKEAKKKGKLIFNMPLNYLGIPNFTDLVEENNPINRFLPTLTENPTLLDLMKSMLDTFTDLNEDPKIWREFRNHSIKSLGNNAFNIDVNDSSFNELLRRTPLQKSFLEFVEETFKHNKSLEKQREYNFFINAYNCLNLLGLDKEKNSKVVFSSFQDDAQHAYYAAHCKYLVSNDEQLLLKARVLYNLFGIETEVLNFKQFEDLTNQEKINEFSVESLIKTINEVLEDAVLEDDIKINDQSKRVLVYKLNDDLLGLFNASNIVLTHKESPMYIFFNEIKNYSKFISFSEFQNITNKIIRVLGVDVNNKNEFEDEDKVRISDGNWKGRTWHFQMGMFHLELEKDTNKLCFYYFPHFNLSE
jgi:hypothetical protein